MANTINASNLTRLAFIDYFRLKTALKKDGQSPTMEITQHDKDTVTYRDLSDTLMEIISQITELTAVQSGTALDAVGFLVSTLITEKVITEEQAEALQQKLIKEWMEQTHGN